jgi:hypothetical protein
MPDRTAAALHEATAEASELIREAVIEIVTQAQDHPLLKNFDDQTKLTCVVDGLLTGTFAAAFSYVRPEGYDEVIDAIKKYLPHAEKKARAIIEVDKMDSQLPQ